MNFKGFLPTGVFFTLHYSPQLVHAHLQPAFIKASLGASNATLKVAEFHAVESHRNPQAFCSVVSSI